MESSVVIAFPDVIGMVGVGCILLMYFAVQTGRLKPAGFIYSMMNLVGALLILYSLIYEFNLSAVIIETAWCVISVIGLGRWWQAKKDKRAESKL